MLYSTVRIETFNPEGHVGLGTGFFLNIPVDEDREIPVLVTNKHVVYDGPREANCARLLFHLKDDSGYPVFESVKLTVTNFTECWIDHPDSEVDLCLMPFAPIVQQVKSTKDRDLFWIGLSLDRVLTDDALIDRLSAVEEVFMFDYPIGLWDDVNNFPIIRRGITASHPGIDFRLKQIGAIDIACFPGSSGAPIVHIQEGIIVDRKTGAVVQGSSSWAFLGILYGGAQQDPYGMIDVCSIPVDSRPLQVKGMLPINVGFYIKAKELKVLCGEFERRAEIVFPEIEM
ncbi:MAG: trypsin-like peptidase domain-containing protein [Cyanobacteria bacterium HKST-UBA02]|nr:trypsin-like peptidase domain-containing protein [Cyanobacteria bacterium HKST-UBA02]